MAKHARKPVEEESRVLLIEEGLQPHLAEAVPLEPVEGSQLKPKRKAGRVVAVIALVVLLAALAALVVYAVNLMRLSSIVNVPEKADEGIEATYDADLSTKEEEAEYYETHKGRPKVYPLFAQCSGVDLHTPVAPADLSGVLFHQASYKYALEMTTELPDANLEEVGKTRQSRVNHEQIEGAWLDADVMHLWRTGDTTAMDTSIDAGAQAGTELRSPVTGTVVLVKDYMLYNTVPDIEIHIQPEGRPDLDVVMIHNADALVKAGDKVEGGVTKVAHVRDIAKDLTDVQLGFYTPADDPGNHSHVQVNNADYQDYRAKKLEGAITVP